MSLRARITSPEPANGTSEESRLVGAYRAKLLEEIDLAEMSALAAAERRARLERVLGHIISARACPVLRGALAAHPARRRRGTRTRHPRTAPGGRLHQRDHGQRPPRPGLRGARWPPRTPPDALLVARTAHADHRTHRLHGQPPRGRVQPDGRRPAPLGRARQRDHPAALPVGPILTIRRFPRASRSRR